MGIPDERFPEGMVVLISTVVGYNLASEQTHLSCSIEIIKRYIYV